MRGADRIATQAVACAGAEGISGRSAPTELGPSKPPVRNVARGVGIPGMNVKSAKITSHAESVVVGVPWRAVVAFVFGPGDVPMDFESAKMNSHPESVAAGVPWSAVSASAFGLGNVPRRWSPLTGGKPFGACGWRETTLRAAASCNCLGERGRSKHQQRGGGGNPSGGESRPMRGVCRRGGGGGCRPRTPPPQVGAKPTEASDGGQQEGGRRKHNRRIDGGGPQKNPRGWG